MVYKESSLHSQALRYERIFHPDHVLCKEDIVWILDFIKKKVADEDPQIMGLSQPRLIKNFQFFAEVAMLLIRQRSSCGHEYDQLRSWLEEASYGISPSPSKEKEA